MKDIGKTYNAPEPLLDLRHLRCFCAVARTGSFTSAARELGLSQPSLSEQIMHLERLLQAPLFERFSRGTELTPAGEALLPRARGLLEEAAAVPQMLAEMQEGVSGPLRIGAIPTILPYFLAPLLQPFLQRYPAVQLQLRETTTEELTTQVQDGLLDLALLSFPVTGAGLIRAELFVEPLLLAVSHDHPLATAAKVNLKKLAGECLLILKDGHCLRRETLTACERARTRFEASFEADQFASIFELIRAGFGVSIVPEMARPASMGCCLIPLEPDVCRHIGYIRPERRYLSKATEMFAAHLRQSVESKNGGL